jgi:D-lactate dehydrogenase (cytochrome)
MRDACSAAITFHVLRFTAREEQSMKTITQSEWRALQAILPADAIVTDPAELIVYEVDGGLGLGNAQGIVLLRDTQQVVALVRWAAANNVPIVARGAGTGLSGGGIAPSGGVIASFARMKQVLEMDEVGRSVVVQPGIVQLTLDEFVKTKGLYYPPDPASGRACTLGGNFGENAGGPHCFKYGVTTNYVMGLEVVLSDGRVIRTGGRAFDYPEYDLTGVLVGSEGTLGLVTEASLRLIRNIPGIKTLMAIFNSVEEAGEAVSAVIARGLMPGTLEMMDKNMIGIVENYVHAGLPTEADALLIIESDGYPESVDPQMEEIIGVMKERKARELRLARTAAERDKIWFARKSAFGAIAQISPAYLIVDGTVPRSKLAQTLGGINQICARHNLRVGYVFHAGDGNLHPLILFDPRDEDMVKRVHRAGDEVMELCVRQGGTITGEHGVGSEKRQYMALMFNVDELRAMQDVKDVFDPKNLLNPGKIIPEGRGQGSGARGQGAEVSSQYLAPNSAEEAAGAMRAWADAGRRVHILGSGTKSRAAPASDAILSTQALRGVKYAINDLYVTVGAGTPLVDLQEELARDKVWVPLASPWAESTIGGIVATNFNAPLRMRYGAIRDLLLAATVALPDGRVLRIGRPVVKNVAGYDLLKLFVGAYGTLGLIGDVTLRLIPYPRARSTLIAPVNDLGQGLALGTRLLRVCLVASSLLLCRGCDTPGVSAPYTLVCTAEGVPEDVRAELVQVRAALQADGVTGAIEVDVPSGTDVWCKLLHSAAPADLTLRAGVAPKDLARVMSDLAPALGNAPFITDFATGMVYAWGAKDVAAVRQHARAADGYAIILSGADGKVDAWGHAPDGLDLMRGLKARWDPRGILNAGAFIV